MYLDVVITLHGLRKIIIIIIYKSEISNMLKALYTKK